MGENKKKQTPCRKLERLAYEQMKEVNDGDSKIIRLLFL